MKPQTLEWNSIQTQLPNLPGWQAEQSPSPYLHRTFTFRNFAQSIQFVNQVAHLAEQANHHPDISIRWNKVTLQLSTHSAGGITQLDLNLAAQINSIPSPA